MTIHHILFGKAVNINTNIVRYFSTFHEEMETEQRNHMFHVFQDEAELGPDERRFFEALPVDEDQLRFIPPSKMNVLRLLRRVGKQDIMLVHSGRMSNFFAMLLLTPWLWQRTALICFGGEIGVWQRIAAATDVKSQMLMLCLKSVVPGIKAVCTLTPGEYPLIQAIFGRANNYQRAFMSSSRRVDEMPQKRQASAEEPTRVLLNQSANAGGRHSEALEWLRRFRHENISVTCPVSFGVDSEASRVIDDGMDCLGEKFSFIKDKRPYDKYSRMVREEMDILILNHLGQAGLGHLYMFLSEGKVAYIRKETPIYEFLGQIGITVRATNSIPGMSFEEFRQPLTRDAAENNIKVFNSQLSTEASVESCKRLIQALRCGHE